MKRQPKANLLINKLHRGAVRTCIGVTLGGLSFLGYRWYQYLTREKPKLEEFKKPAVDTELLQS